MSAATPSVQPGANGPQDPAPEPLPLPPGYDREEVDRLLEQVAQGRTLTRVLETIAPPGFEHRLRAWIIDDVDGLARRYARARVMQAEVWADRAFATATEVRLGVITKDGPKGLEIRTGDMVERARLEVDTLKWLIAKLHPVQYGDMLPSAPAGEVNVNQEFAFTISADGAPGVFIRGGNGTKQNHDGNGNGVGANGGHRARLGAN